MRTEQRSGVLIFCQGYRKTGAACRNILGKAIDDVIVIKHGGREITNPESIRCEDCGTVWRRA